MGAKKPKKRANSAGSIYQRKDGLWVAAVTLPSNGKRKVLYGRTQLEVEGKLAKTLSNLGIGIEPAGKETVESFLNYWLEHTVKPKLRPKTYRSYEQHVRNHLVPALGRIQLARLTPAQVQAMLNTKAEVGLSPYTVDGMRQVLRNALNQALKWGMVQRNVAALVDAPRKEKRDLTYLDLDQVAMFLRTIRGDRLEALWVTAIGTGLRQGELLGLRWQDVDLERGTLRVRVQLQRVDGQFRLVPTKTARSQRTVDLPMFVQNVIERHLDDLVRLRQATADDWDNWDLIFTTQTGRPLDSSNVYHRYRKLLEHAGLPLLRFHDLRHTAATLLLSQEVDLRTIMEIMGHSQFSLTMDTYSHVLPSLKAKAAQRMDTVLNQAAGD